MVNSLSFAGAARPVASLNRTQATQQVRFAGTEAPPEAQQPVTAEAPETGARSFKTKVLDGLKKSALTQGIGVALDVAAFALAPFTAGFSLALLLPGVVLNAVGLYKFVKGYKNGNEAPAPQPEGTPAPEVAKAEAKV